MFVSGVNVSLTCILKYSGNETYILPSLIALRNEFQFSIEYNNIGFR